MAAHPLALGSLLVALGISSLAWAQGPKIEGQVVPTEAEWAQLPGYCQARYGITLYANGTPFQGRVPPQEVQRWKQKMGDNVWAPLHHYCYGLIQLLRGPLVMDRQQRNFVYTRARDEFSYAYQRTSKSEPFAAEIAVRLSMTYRAQNSVDQALRYANEAMKINPKLESAYSIKALILRQKGSLKDAVETLRAGLDALDGQSAELCYFLGLTYIDLGQVDLAKEYADKAYALGYPLPGLRNRLARLAREDTH